MAAETKSVVMLTTVADVNLGRLDVSETYEVPEELASQWIKAGYAEDEQHYRMRKAYEEQKAKVEEGKKKEEYRVLAAVLKELGLVIEVDSCGCCGGAWLEVHYQGVKLFDQQGDYSNREEVES